MPTIVQVLADFIAGTLEDSFGREMGYLLLVYEQQEEGQIAQPNKFVTNCNPDHIADVLENAAYVLRNTDVGIHPIETEH